MADALTKTGRYQIVGELGRGSMGVVYQGYDPVIGRTVAIKTMLTEGATPQEFQEYKTRFQREAMAAGILAHPNIITVYDFGEDNGVLYLAMEFLEGKSLEKHIQEQTVLPIETILPIYDQVCGALDHAHRNKIVHRDIKPANIMILSNGLVKVTDFGIAKMMAMGMTQAGQILGTPNYMSPEQVKGRQIDGRSDIFSLGVILYELVTGEKPFGGQNITTVIYKIINENPIPPRELDASIPSGLSFVISKALAKNVEERYQTCRELAEDLRNYKNLGGSPIVGGGTVILKAPAIAAEPEPEPEVELPDRTLPLPGPGAAQPRRAAPTATVAETPISSEPAPINIHMIPPAAGQRKSVPQIMWVLAALLIVAIAGGAAYWWMMRPQNQPQPAPVQVTPQPTPPVVNPPATEPGTQPAAQAGTQPGTQPSGQEATATAPAASTPAANTPPAVSTTAPAQPAAAEPAKPKPEPAKADNRTHAAVSKVGQLMVSANITGAKISVDGNSQPNWVTPFTIPDLPAGVHNIEISMNGYDPYWQSVTITAGQTTTLAGNLSAPSAGLNVVTDPPGVEVLIDDKSYGPSPVNATLTPGTHTYTIKWVGASPSQGSVKLANGDLRRISGKAPALTGIVVARTIPPGATVLENGAPISGNGGTPASFRLSVGQHTLVFSLNGYKPVTQQVTVLENQTTPVNITLNSQ